MMETFKFYLLPSLINFVGAVYLQHKILNRKIDFKKTNLYICLVLFLIFNILIYLYVDGILRMVTNTIILLVLSYVIFHENLNTVSGAIIIQQILLFFSELFVAVILKVFNIDINLIKSIHLYFILENLLVIVISILLYKIPVVNKLITKIIINLNKIKQIKKYVFVIILFATLNVLISFICFPKNDFSMIILNLIFIFVYVFIMYIALNEKSENVKYKEQNKMLLDNLNEYEKMLDYQRVNNHENKNQLLVIQGMIDKTNTKALEYLDEVIKEKREDDEGIYTSASIIPQGGLQGLVYQKMLKMKENNITINLKVERKVRKINLDNLPSKTNYDLCRAVGIIIDNAIEENLNLKEREILICMYILDEYLVIEVSNKCSIIPDMTRLDEKGYTTKSNGHGYGLSLLKEIVDSNKNIINERSINKDIFTQIIKIKK